MIRFQFFPRSQGITKPIRDIITCFELEDDKIKSPDFNLSSNDVLEVVRPHLEKIDFTCETGKTVAKKISVPVLFGYDNKIDKAFNADAVSNDGKIVIEIEAGRATENNQFLKDIFQACMMFEVDYFNEIKPVFDKLAKLRTVSKSTQKWETLGDYHTSVYTPVLDAFRRELMHLDSENPGIIAERLIEYLIARQDFYKIIKGKNKVEIQAFNLRGTLNLPFENIKPKAKIQKLKLTNRLIKVVYQENSKTTLLVTLNEGWQISFRIHNASSRIEPSLKFDINLVSAPHSLFSNQLFIS